MKKVIHGALHFVHLTAHVKVRFAQSYSLTVDSCMKEEKSIEFYGIVHDCCLCKANTYDYLGVFLFLCGMFSAFLRKTNHPI